jgi:hypothetical protein
VTKTLIVLALTLVTPLLIWAQTVTKTVSVASPGAGENRYIYVPFEVPKNTESVSFSFEYDKRNGSNNLEFGLFDSQFSGKTRDKNGFRGWSGSVRESIFISRETATNGYTPGAIQPGTWYVIVGLARLESGGVKLKLEMDLNRIDTKPLGELENETAKKFRFKKLEKLAPIRTNGLTWFRGDLHSHSFHSDGRWTIKAMLESARSNNLDFLAITDHNTISNSRDIDGQLRDFEHFLLVRGEEVTTHGGHINVWGLTSGNWVDFRVLPGLRSSADQIADESHKLGALASVNHPTMTCFGCAWSYGDDWGSFDSVEIWNARWDEGDESALKIWDGLLQQGKILTAVGSSDSHLPPYEPSTYPTNLDMGEPTVFVGAEKLAVPDILNGIKRGRVVVTESSREFVEFTAGNATTTGDRIAIVRNQRVKLRALLKGFPANSICRIISGGNTLKEWVTSGDKNVFTYITAPKAGGYVRIEIRAQGGRMLAFTNPIYFRIKQ